MAVDRVATLLRALPLTNAQRAEMWDIFAQAKTPAALEAALTSKNIPQETKAILWDLKAGGGVSGRLPSPSEKETQGLGRATWEGVKNFGTGALELVTRPGEFVSGTATGLAKTGSLAKGLQRGVTAVSEPDLVNSQNRENWAKVIEALNPEFAKARPGTTAALGFAGDVVFDPLNLLIPGLGIVRGTAAKGLQKLGASKRAAEVAMGAQLGEKWAQHVVTPAGKALVSRAADSKLGDMFPSLRMRNLTATGKTPETAGFAGLTGQQTGQTLSAQDRAAERAVKAEVEKLYKGITPEDKKLLSWATTYSESPQAAQVAADPRLSSILAETRRLYRKAIGAEQAAGAMPKIRSLDIKPEIEEALKNLTPQDREMLQRALQEGPTVDPSAIPNELKNLANTLRSKIWRTEPGLGTYYFADPATVELLDSGKVTVAKETRNYGPTIFPSSSHIGSSRLRWKPKAAEDKSLTFAEAAELGAETDASVLLLNRLKDSEQAQANIRRMQVYTKEFGVATPTKGYRKLLPETIEKMPEELGETVKSIHLPNAVADELEHYILRVIDPDLESGISGLLQRGTRLFKTMATTLGFPSYHATNFLGNSVNMYAGANMSPTEVVTGIKNSTLAMTGATSKSNWLGPVRIGNATYTTDAEIIDQARKYGVIGTQAGSFGVEIGEKTPIGLAKVLGAESGPLAVVNPDWSQYQKFRKVNQEYIEDPAKLALFVHELRKGKSAEQASVTVRRVLFDYDELSEKERTIRHYIPFYTWMRKNIPLQLATLAERPAKLSHQGQFLNALREWTRLSGETVAEQADLPQYMQTGEYVPVPLQSTKGSPVLLRARLPWFDVGALGGIVDPSKTFRTVAERFNPIYRVPYALGTGTDPVTQQSLEGMRRADFLGRILPVGMGGGVETERGLQQTARAKQVTGAIPIPFGAPLRALFPDEDAETLRRSASGLPLQELILRSLGAAPRIVTPEMLKQAREERKRNVQKAKAAAKQARYFDRY